MAEKVSIDIDVTGGSDAAREFEEVAVAQQKAGEKAQELSRKLKELQKAEGDNTEEVERYRRELVKTQEAKRKLGQRATELRGKINESKNSFAEFSTGLRSGVVAAAAVSAAIIGAFRAAKAFGDEMERQIGILNRSTGSIDAAAIATGGLVSNIDLVTSRNRTMQAGLTLTDQQFADLAEVATDFAAATGQEAAGSIEQLANALVNLSAEELRRYGLEIDTSKDRTQQLASAMDQLRGRAASMETGADSLGGSLARLGVMLENDKTEALLLAEAIGTDLVEALGLADSELGEAAESANLLQEGVMMLFGPLSELARPYLEEVRNQLEMTKDAASALKLELQSLMEQGFPTGPTTMGGAFDDASTDVGITPAQRARARAIAANREEEEARRRSASNRESASDREARLNTEAIAGLGNFADPAIEESSVRNELAKEEARVREEAEAQKFEAVKQAEEGATAKARAEARERQQEAERVLREQEKAAQERIAKITADAESVLKPAISGITDALSNIIAGTQSADEAFQGMLSSFLAMIAEQAALEAAKEFAAAIASFASYQYDAGALHLAAGAAWTGVAVAAGAGAIATAPAEAAPVGPEQGAANTGQGGGGSTYVYNVSGPVITAGSKANAGREISGVIDEGNRRFGRAA